MMRYGVGRAVVVGCLMWGMTFAAFGQVGGLPEDPTGGKVEGLVDIVSGELEGAWNNTIRSFVSGMPGVDGESFPSFNQITNGNQWTEFVSDNTPGGGPADANEALEVLRPVFTTLGFDMTNYPQEATATDQWSAFLFDNLPGGGEPPSAEELQKVQWVALLLDGDPDTPEGPGTADGRVDTIRLFTFLPVFGHRTMFTVTVDGKTIVINSMENNVEMPVSVFGSPVGSVWDLKLQPDDDFLTGSAPVAIQFNNLGFGRVPGVNTPLAKHPLRIEQSLLGPVPLRGILLGDENGVPNRVKLVFSAPVLKESFNGSLLHDTTGNYTFGERLEEGEEENEIIVGITPTGAETPEAFDLVSGVPAEEPAPAFTYAGGWIQDTSGRAARAVYPGTVEEESGIAPDELHLLLAETADSDGDGMLDRVKLVWSRTVDDGTFDPSKLSIEGDDSGTLAWNMTDPVISPDSDDAQTWIRLADPGAVNTGATGTLRVTDPGVIEDSSGLKPPVDETVDLEDGALPVVVSVDLVTDGAGNVVGVNIVMSERIAEVGSGDTDLSRWNLEIGGESVLEPSMNPQVAYENEGGRGVVRFSFNPVTFSGEITYRYDNSDGGNPDANPLQDEAGNVLTFLSNNLPPVAVLEVVLPGGGSETEPGWVTLDGSGSTDDKLSSDELTYTWGMLSGPGQTVDWAPFNEGNGSQTARFLLNQAGTYTFELTVSDGSLSDAATAQMTVLNISPTPHAGFDVVVEKGESVTLDGRFTGDANDYEDGGGTRIPDTGPESFLWRQADNGADDVSDELSDTGLIQATFETGDVDPDTYEFELEVTDVGDPDQAGDELTRTARVRVVVLDPAAPVVPTAEAGPDFTGEKDSPITLIGSGSRDPAAEGLHYQWTKMEGPEVALDDATAAPPVFTPQEAGVYRFRLEVRTADGAARSIPDEMWVVVPPVSTWVIGADQAVEVGMEVTLTASGEGISSLRWDQVEGVRVTLSGQRLEDRTFMPVRPGMYAFDVTGLNGEGNPLTLPARVYVSVRGRNGGNQAPLVENVGEKQNGMTGDLILLEGQGSDPDGDALGHHWIQVEGPWTALTDRGTDAPSFTPQYPGVYRFRYVVDDGKTVGITDEVCVVIDAAADAVPVADAGPDLEVPVDTQGELDGAASADPDGADLIGRWLQITGGSQVLGGVGENSLTPVFSPTEGGTLTFQLRVFDGILWSKADTVVVEVTGGSGNAPGTPGGGGSSSGGGGGGGGCWIACGIDARFPWFALAVFAIFLFRRTVDWKGGIGAV